MMSDQSRTPRPGDALYVPEAERGMAASLGASMVEGDARLFVPTVLPGGVDTRAFARWMTAEARVVWLGEFLAGIVGEESDILNIGTLMSDVSSSTESADDIVPLYVPRSEMDRARRIPGVWWDRARRMYVADRTASFGLVHRYLTPSMKSAWIVDRNADTAINALVRARAIIEDDDTGQKDPREIDWEKYAGLEGADDS